MAYPLLQVDDIRKRFCLHNSLIGFLRKNNRQRSVVALDRVSFTVNEGEIIGLVGPNGAGKTTLMRILADLLLADRGEVYMEGVRIDGTAYEHRQQIGYVSSDERSFYWRLTGRANLEFFARLYGLSRKKFGPLVDQMLDEFGLLEKSTQLFRDYSAGTRKKFVLIRALLHQPRLLLLDELTNSLDPPTAQQVKSLVRDYVNQSPSRAAIWSTHRLEEVKEVCDRVISIANGQIMSIESTHEKPSLTEV